VHVDVEWSSEGIRLDGKGDRVPDIETLPPNGEVKEQWTVTAKKRLGPHTFEQSLTCNQLGTPPVIICRDLEKRAVRSVEQKILWYRELATEGMAETG
jgi:hypothetical protein